VADSVSAKTSQQQQIDAIGPYIHRKYRKYFVWFDEKPRAFSSLLPWPLFWGQFMGQGRYQGSKARTENP
jgi:hypothetical protein